MKSGAIIGAALVILAGLGATNAFAQSAVNTIEGHLAAAKYRFSQIRSHIYE